MTAVAIGPPAAVESYLVIEKIVAACKESGAEAVHPGYGFLSEREAFPKALTAAGIVFIGPNPKAIAAMGDKIESKKAAAAAKVSTVPGHLGVIENEVEAIEIAEEIGYPVMIKAARAVAAKACASPTARPKWWKASRGRVRRPSPRSATTASLSRNSSPIRVISKSRCSATSMATSSISASANVRSSGAIRKSSRRRHRHCSTQRRARRWASRPSRLPKPGYDSAGTVEFVAGQDKSFYFLEMNTRLQVEHPVTELITGIDLVEQMIRVAAGEKLSIKQSDVKLDGWAVESRVYAEDPYRNFLPSTGRLTRYRPPQGRRQGVTVRNDTGVYEGGEISLYYDPMIAKLVTHAPTRGAAIAAQSDALDCFVVDGIRHNIPFLAALMAHPRWQAGKLSTGFIAEVSCRISCSRA